MIQRDYIDRLFEQCAAALSRMLRHRKAGRQDSALHEYSAAADRVLGQLRPLVERMEADSAVAFVGRIELDRLRLFAALLCEEGLVRQARNESALAYLSWRRALQLYAAVSLAGARLDGADRNRIAVLTSNVDVAELDQHHQAELRRLAGDRGRPR